MRFIDTHCHIQEIVPETQDHDIVQTKWQKGNITDVQQVLMEAQAAGVSDMIVVGCSLQDSRRAVALAASQANCYASIGVHPHEAKDHLSQETLGDFTALASDPSVVAIGECGLDYFYTHSPKADQITVLEHQLQVAQDHALPLIFHVREAFDDFWPVFDNFSDLRGVIHSFTANIAVLDEVLSRGLYVGLNGIMTFTTDEEQLEMAKAVPLNRLLLETDAPFLTPKPFRGTICQPKHVVLTAEFLGNMRGEGVATIADATTRNAISLFKL